MWSYANDVFNCLYASVELDYSLSSAPILRMPIRTKRVTYAAFVTVCSHSFGMGDQSWLGSVMRLQHVTNSRNVYEYVTSDSHRVYHVWTVQARAPTTEPSVWEVRKRGSGIPKPSSALQRPPQTTPHDQRKRPKMSDISLSGEPFDYCTDDVPEVPPNHTTKAFVPRHPPISSLDLEIAEKQLQLLQWRRAMEMQEPGGNSSTYYASEMTESFGQPSYSRDTKSRRRVALKQQQAQEATFRDARGPRKHIVEVDLRGHPQGQNRPLWLTCLRGHAQDIDFSEDNYKNIPPLCYLLSRNEWTTLSSTVGGWARCQKRLSTPFWRASWRWRDISWRKECRKGRTNLRTFGTTIGWSSQNSSWRRKNSMNLRSCGIVELRWEGLRQPGAMKNMSAQIW